MATFLFVHGAFVGGWSWKKVTARLRTAGHEVYTPTLTGLGERVHLLNPDIDLETHIQDILDAFIPQDGQSALDLFDQEDRAAIEERVQRGGEGWLLPPREKAHYGITTQEDTRWAWEKFGLQPFKTWQQPVRLTNPVASTLPRTYIFCTATEGFPFAPSAQRARTEAGWRYRELATAHYAMIAAPVELTQMLLELV